MSCYLRHMRRLFDTLGLPYDKPNRRLVDRAPRDRLGMTPDTPCPQVWARVKDMSETNQAALASDLQRRLG